MNLSRYIPAGIRHQVRQRCGFGCVICGLPVYEYDHITGFTTADQHDAEDIILLCSNHHDQKTRGHLSVEAIKQANRNPINVARGVSSPYGLRFDSDCVHFLLASNRFTTAQIGTPFPVLRVDGTDLIRLFISKNGGIYLDLELYNAQNARVLSVIQNELVYSIESWDIRFVGKTLTLRDKRREIVLRFSFHHGPPPLNVKIDVARLYYAGVDILINKEIVSVPGGGSIAGCTAFNCGAGLSIGTDPGPGSALYVSEPFRFHPLSQAIKIENSRIARKEARNAAKYLDPAVYEFGGFVSIISGAEDLKVVHFAETKSVPKKNLRKSKK